MRRNSPKYPSRADTLALLKAREQRAPSQPLAPSAAAEANGAQGGALRSSRKPLAGSADFAAAGRRAE